MLCKVCFKHIKNLTRYRHNFKVFCLGHDDYPNKYHFDTIPAGDNRIYPWDNIDKCFNIRQSPIIRSCLTSYIKKYGGQFYIRRHLAGMQVYSIANNEQKLIL